MNNQLVKLTTKNYRSLADLSIEVNNLNILFGANGVGKSTFLDIIWFLRDCAIRGVEFAASHRDHGIGLLWDLAEDDSNIVINLENAKASHQVSFGYSRGRIENFVGEELVNKITNKMIFKRTIGSDKVMIYNNNNLSKSFVLKEPSKLALTQYVQREDSQENAETIDQLLRNVRFYVSRLYPLYKLKRYGSDSSYGDRLEDRAENLWSVLRNLHDKQAIDDRYLTIIKLMREAFPNFDNIYFESTGKTSIYAGFVEKNRRQPIQASGISDGHLQLLINLTALFSEGEDNTIILMDEPETSLHPWALVIFAKAVKLAVEKWNKQVIIATHHPVLLSQFSPENVLTFELDLRGKTMIKKVSEMIKIKDLLEDYPLGSLYMAEAIAPQSKTSNEEK